MKLHDLITSIERAIPQPPKMPDLDRVGAILIAALRDPPAQLVELSRVIVGDPDRPIREIEARRHHLAISPESAAVYVAVQYATRLPPSWDSAECVRAIVAYLKSLSRKREPGQRHTFRIDGDVLVFDGDRFPIANDRARRFMEALSDGKPHSSFALQTDGIRAADAYNALPRPVKAAIRRPKRGGREGWFLDADAL